MCVIKTILAVTNAFIIKAAVLGWILEPVKLGLCPIISFHQTNLDHLLWLIL